jgi:tetratricopeptide (TPR) repeat protein
VRGYRAYARLARGNVEGALDDLRRSLPPARSAGDPQALVPALVLAARVHAEVGRIEEAKRRAREALAEAPLGWTLLDLAWFAGELDCAEELAAQLARLRMETPWTDATRMILAGDLVAAVEIFREIGSVPEEAYARLRLAEQLVAEGRRAEADEQLRRSLAFWRSVGATRYVRRGEALLAAAS